MKDHCEVGTNEHCVRVFGFRSVFCDKCLSDIVGALNMAGIKTIASCCGHGITDARIDLADGTTLTISKDHIERREQR